MRVKIEVTQECIDKGASGSCTYCPIALATKPLVRIFNSVGFSYLYLTPRFSLRLPKRAANFILRFDCKEPVKPFSFVIDIPKEFLKEGV